MEALTSDENHEISIFCLREKYAFAESETHR